MDSAINASQNPTSSPTAQGPNKPCSVADKLPTPPKSPKPTKRPARNLLAELAPDKGFPETNFFSSFTEDGSRRSTRARKPIVRTAPEPVSPPPELAKKKRPTRTNRPKRLRAAASRSSAKKATYADTGYDKAPEEVEAGPPSAGISEAAVEQAAEAYISDSCYLDTGLSTTHCDRCNDVCRNCASQTMSAVNLLESPDGRNTWYVGPYGLFEIGQLRFPRTRKSVTYVRGEIWAETWATPADAEAAGVELDSETEDGDDEAVRAEFDVEMGNEDAVVAAAGLYSMMGAGDDETVDGEDGENGEEPEKAEEVGLEELIREWREFCLIGRKEGWVPWLSCLERPAHIDRKKWTERSRRRADELNARHEAKIAAKRAGSCL
ncbi:hypothetical protein VE03_08285 [Pseudogymnoascus sp. 23342-1-I1]|nr:hypothetical protein VE03_08285 [Pseudogymnoascus sp. 23342-1-I1]